MIAVNVRGQQCSYMGSVKLARMRSGVLTDYNPQRDKEDEKLDVVENMLYAIGRRQTANWFYTGAPCGMDYRYHGTFHGCYEHFGQTSHIPCEMATGDSHGRKGHVNMDESNLFNPLNSISRSTA